MFLPTLYITVETQPLNFFIYMNSIASKYIQKSLHAKKIIILSFISILTLKYLSTLVRYFIYNCGTINSAASDLTMMAPTAKNKAWVANVPIGESFNKVKVSIDLEIKDWFSWVEGAPVAWKFIMCVLWSTL